MTEIGNGYWYRVYDLGNGRVLKVEKSAWEKIVHVYRLESFTLLGWLRASLILLTYHNKIRAAYARLARQVPAAFLGNPKFLTGIDYEQGKVGVFGGVLERSTAKEQEAMLGQFTTAIIESWRHGFSDKDFSFTSNYGYDPAGKLRLVDFNMITFSKAVLEAGQPGFAGVFPGRDG
jgi:hypothetical protein